MTRVTVPKVSGIGDLSEDLLIPGVISSIGSERKKYYDLIR